jgi:hypothetical protein
VYAFGALRRKLHFGWRLLRDGLGLSREGR